MFKKIFLLSISAGIFSSVACIVYYKVYYFALETDFSKIVNPRSMISVCLIACILAGTLYYFIKKWFLKKGKAVFNLVFVLLSFASIIVPFYVDIPVDIKNPELFYGLVIPMHFFPAVSWLALKELFIKE